MKLVGLKKVIATTLSVASLTFLFVSAVQAYSNSEHPFGQKFRRGGTYESCSARTRFQKCPSIVKYTINTQNDGDNFCNAQYNQLTLLGVKGVSILPLRGGSPFLVPPLVKPHVWAHLDNGDCVVNNWK